MEVIFCATHFQRLVAGINCSSKMAVNHYEMQSRSANELGQRSECRFRLTGTGSKARLESQTRKPNSKECGSVYNKFLICIIKTRFATINSLDRLCVYHCAVVQR